MSRLFIRHPAAPRRLAVAATLLAGLVLAPGLALAGGCPAGKSGTDVRAKDTTPARDVTDNVIASIDVAKEPAAIKDRLFRMRRLEIKAGGVVPWHSHDDRPAIIYVIQGTVEEYASNCSVPIVHQAGDVTTEMHGTAHWWKNNGKTTVILLSADLLHTGDNEHMM